MFWVLWEWVTNVFSVFQIMYTSLESIQEFYNCWNCDSWGYMYTYTLQGSVMHKTMLNLNSSMGNPVGAFRGTTLFVVLWSFLFFKGNLLLLYSILLLISYDIYLALNANGYFKIISIYMYGNHCHQYKPHHQTTIVIIIIITIIIFTTTVITFIIVFVIIVKTWIVISIS